jgi:hypothetical protein
VRLPNRCQPKERHKSHSLVGSRGLFILVWKRSRYRDSRRQMHLALVSKRLALSNQKAPRERRDCPLNNRRQKGSPVLYVMPVKKSNRRFTSPDQAKDFEETSNLIAMKMLEGINATIMPICRTILALTASLDADDCNNANLNELCRKDMVSGG